MQRDALEMLHAALERCETYGIELYHGISSISDGEGDFVWQGHAEVGDLLDDEISPL